MNLLLTPLDWLVCLSTLGGSVALGLFVASRIQAGASSTNFFLAGRQLTWPVIGASLFATNIGAEHLVGLSGDAYRYGLCAGTVELTTVLCLGVGAAVLFPYYIKNRVFTIPEFLEIRYHPICRVFFSALMLLICVVTKMAFTLYAGALVINSLLGWNVMLVVTVIGILTALFTMKGGFAAIAYTDTIQTTIMIIGCGIMVLLGLGRVGGWHGLAHLTPEAIRIAKPYTDPNYPFLGIMAAAAYGGIFYWGIDQVNVQRVLGAKDLHQARWGAMFGILLKLSPVFIFALPGVIALALFPGREPKLTFVTLLNDLMPTGLRGLVLSALLAALISSLDAVMNSISTMTVRDFVVRLRPKTSEGAQVVIGRVAIMIGTILGIGAAYLVYITPEGLYKYLQTISIYLVMPVMPAIFFGILSKKVTFKGAIASVGVGGALAAIFVSDQWMGVEAGTRWFPWIHNSLTLNYAFRGLWGTLIIIATLFIVSTVTEKTAPDKLEKTTIRWGAKAEPFTGLSDWRLHLAVLSGVTVALYAWLW
jgi:SSS family solute:Na+ symporter